MKLTEVLGADPSFKETDWYRLDNAGKLFPCTKNKFDTKVFRFSPELMEDVVPELL